MCGVFEWSLNMNSEEAEAIYGLLCHEKEINVGTVTSITLVLTFRRLISTTVDVPQR